METALFMNFFMSSICTPISSELSELGISTNNCSNEENYFVMLMDAQRQCKYCKL